MAVEESGANSEHVNSLFRVFHTIKGTAGFLELQDVVDLAHTTETMLNRCRQGELALEGDPTDLCLEATAVMRAMLDAVRSRSSRASLGRAADMTGLLARIQAATENPAQAAPKPAPSAGTAPAVAAPEAPASPAPPSATSPAPPPAVAAPPPAASRPEAPAKRAEPPHDAPAAADPGHPESRQAADGTVKLKDTIKVDLERVDSLVEMIGELVVVESMVVNAPEIVADRLAHASATASASSPRSPATCRTWACACAWCRCAASSRRWRAWSRDLGRKPASTCSCSSPARPPRWIAAWSSGSPTRSST